MTNVIPKHKRQPQIQRLPFLFAQGTGPVQEQPLVGNAAFLRNERNKIKILLRLKYMYAIIVSKAI